MNHRKFELLSQQIPVYHEFSTIQSLHTINLRQSMTLKTLQNSSAITKISITLFSMSIAIQSNTL